jgi:hypothetical protein
MWYKFDREVPSREVACLHIHDDACLGIGGKYRDKDDAIFCVKIGDSGCAMNLICGVGG